MQDKATYPGIAKTIEQVRELSEYLERFLEVAEEDLTLKEIERLHLYLKTADLISIDPTHNKTFEQNWEQIKAEASQIEADREWQEEQDRLFWENERQFEEQHYNSTRGVA